MIPATQIAADSDVARIESVVASIIGQFCSRNEIVAMDAPSRRFNPGGQFTLRDDLADILVRELRRDGAIPIPFPPGTFVTND